MTMFHAVEHPTGRAPVRWVFDVAVMLFAAVAALPNLFHGGAHRSAVTFVAVIAIILALLVRRIWPIPVFVWMGLFGIALGLGYHDAVPGFALLIALYTVAATQPRRVVLIAAGVFELGIVAVVIKVAGGAWWYDAIFLTGMVVAAVGLGLYVATRRAYLIELHDRAARLERERDQQGALAAAAERARIAREMHDIVAHHLTVMVALSDGAVAASAKSPERAAEVMRSVSATGRRALADTRRLLGVLRDGAEDGTGDALHPMPSLAELDALIDQVRAAGIPTTLQIGGTAADVPPGVQLTVYRLVQEALTNTLKHGGSDVRASVRLHYGPGELRVEVDDDGAGVTATAPAGVGGGLAGMRERVHAYGGDIESGPQQPSGWRVAARLRLDDGGDA
jgi:signal transduction histidine kinase